MQAKLALCAEWFWPGFPDLAKIPRGIEPLKAACSQTAALGYRAIELVAPLLAESPLLIPAAEREAMKEVITGSGLEFAGFHWSMLGADRPVHLTDPDRFTNNVEWLVGLGHLTFDLGGRIIVLGSPKQRNIAAVPGLKYQNGFEAAVHVLRAVADRLPPTVTIAFEQLSDMETDFVTTFAEAIRLVDAVDSNRIKLVWDYKALLQMGVAPYDAALLLRSNPHRIVHVHMNDIDLGGPRPDGTTIDPVITAIGEACFRGYVSIEVFNGATVPLEQTARVAAAHIRQTCGRLWI